MGIKAIDGKVTCVYSIPILNDIWNTASYKHEKSYETSIYQNST